MSSYPFGGLLCSVPGCLGLLSSSSWCSRCYDRRAERRQKSNDRRRQKYADDPAYRDQAKSAHKARYAADPDYRASSVASAKRWVEQNRQEAYEKGVARRQAKLGTPEYKAQRQRSKNARKNRLAGAGALGVSLASKAGIFNAPCAWCGAPGPSTVDHILPLSWVDGLPEVAECLGKAWCYQPLCGSCNRRKGAHFLLCLVPTGPVGLAEEEYALGQSRKAQMDALLNPEP